MDRATKVFFGLAGETDGFVVDVVDAVAVRRIQIAAGTDTAFAVVYLQFQFQFQLQFQLRIQNLTPTTPIDSDSGTAGAIVEAAIAVAK